MGLLDTVENAFRALVFLTPGLIAMAMNRLYQPSDSPNWQNDLATLLLVSVLNFVFFGWLASSSFATGAVPDSWTVRLALGAYIVLGPVILLLTYVAIVRALSAFGILLRPRKTAWDELFLRKRCYWVIVHFHDGRKVGGRYRQRSYATLYPVSGHLYLQEIWKLDEDGAFKHKVDRSAGMLFRPEDYHYIEFFEE